MALRVPIVNQIPFEQILRGRPNRTFTVNFRCKYTSMTLGTVADTLEGNMISSRQIPSGSISGTKLQQNSVPYLDGGCSCKIPYQWALDQGFGRILVIRTREVEFRKANKVSHAALRVYRRYPAFVQKLSVSNLDYNQQCDNIERLHEEGRLMRLAPSKTVIVSRVEKDVEKLGELYHLGRTDCFNQLDEIYHYLTKR